MRSIKLIVFCFYLLTTCALAQENDYSISKIPADLRKNSKSVVRKKIQEFTILNEREAELKTVFAVTIFDKSEQRKYGDIYTFYSGSDEIEEFEAFIYDENGNELKELDSDDIADYPAYDGLMGDTRVKAAELDYPRFPYTLEYTIEQSLDGFWGYNWFSRKNLDPVEYAAFKITAPEDYELRIWEKSDSVKAVQTKNGSKKVYLWEFFNQPDLTGSNPGDISDVAEEIKLAPSDFTIEGHKGNMRSWKDFGYWMGSLYKNRNILTEPVLTEVTSLLSPDDDVHTKIEKLYRYMQSKTRYISVQLGIGGWQPFDAAYVHERGYGDCKALTNYMSALLSAAGIKSYPAVINRESAARDILIDFPSNQFNHVILFVPLERDSIWLECTSKTIPMNHLGADNENRHALLLTEEGGRLIKTPSSSPSQNTQFRKTEVKISEGGNAEVASNVTWSGNQHDYVRNRLDEASGDEKEKWVINRLDVPDKRLTSFQFEGLDDFKPIVSLNLQAYLPKYASISGKRMFFKPNMMERAVSVPDTTENRIAPIRLGYPYLDIDSVIYKIPSGYEFEALPAELQINNSYGSYSGKVIPLDNHSLLYVRRLQLNSYLIPAEFYNEYRNFYSELIKADRMQVVIVKK